MAQRLRLQDVRSSRFPRVLGLCQSNIPQIAAAANAAQAQLIYDKAAGEESWQGSWAEILFNVSRSQPFATVPREIARLESCVVCDKPVEINNQFAEYLRFGNGRMSANSCRCPDVLAVYARNNAVTFTDLSNPPQLIRVYSTSDQDVNKRVLIQGWDNNDVVVYSQDSAIRVQGIFLNLDTTPTTSVLSFNRITGIQKDATVAQVQIYQVDPTTGDEVLLLTMEPGETTASYRRYYFNNLPSSCCPVPGAAEGTVQVRAIAKLDLIPVVVDTDYLLLQNLEALIEQATAIRLMESDTMSAQQMAAAHHQRAIRLLIGELGHWNGVHDPALGFSPFGRERSDMMAFNSM